MHFRKFQCKKTAGGTLCVPPVGIGLKSITAMNRKVKKVTIRKKGSEQAINSIKAYNSNNSKLVF